MISGTIIVASQLFYLNNKDIGFDKEDVLVTSVQDSVLRHQMNAFKTELLKNPNVKKVATSSFRIGFGGGKTVHLYEGEGGIEVGADGERDGQHVAPVARAGRRHVQCTLDSVHRLLDRHRDRVAVKVELEKQTVDYPPLQRSILETVREHGTVNAALLIRATGANRNTLKDNLRKLVDRGVLERTGQKRGTRYRLPSTDRPKDLRGH